MARPPAAFYSLRWGLRELVDACHRRGIKVILDAAWRKGQSPDLAAIIQAVQKPPFEKLGVFDLESFFPAKERMDLAVAKGHINGPQGHDGSIRFCNMGGRE